MIRRAADVCVAVVEFDVLSGGIERLWGHGAQDWGLIRQAAGVGLFVAVVEETLRFSIGRVPLREDPSDSLFSTAAAFESGLS